MGRAADEIDRLPPAQVEAYQRRHVAAEDNPERARRPDRQRQRHPPGRRLPQDHPAEQRRQDRRQGEDGGGRNRRRCLQPLEHQDEVARKQPAEGEVAPGRREVPRPEPPGRKAGHADHRRGEGEAQRREGDRRDLVRHHRAERERARHQHGKEQHRDMALRRLAHLSRACSPCAHPRAGP